MAHMLDTTDRQIVAMLQTDGRTANVDIARHLGIAEGTVRKRLERLLSSGVIRIAAIADPDKLGRATRIFVGIEADVAQLEAIAERLSAIPEIHSVNIVTGSYDLIVEAVLSSSDQLLSFLLDNIAAIPGIKRTETCHVLRVVKQPYDWAIPDERPAHSGAQARRAAPSPEVIPGSMIVPG